MFFNEFQNTESGLNLPDFRGLFPVSQTDDSLVMQNLWRHMIHVLSSNPS